MMPYCPNCGAESEHSVPLISPAAEAVSVELEIARVNAERDIAVEKIRARAARDELETTEAVAEVEAEAAVEVASSEAEVIGEIIAEGGDDEPEPEGAPIVIEPPAESGPDVPPPPEAEEHHHSPAKPKGIFGF